MFMTCRLCGSELMRSVVDLGATPPCELFLTADGLNAPEPTYPLHLRVCEACLLLQIPALILPEETFVDYAQYASFSDSWVEHARHYVATAVDRLGLDETSRVVERGIQCLGIEPSVNVGEAARERGVPT